MATYGGFFLVFGPDDPDRPGPPQTVSTTARWGMVWKGWPQSELRMFESRELRVESRGLRIEEFDEYDECEEKKSEE